MTTKQKADKLAEKADKLFLNYILIGEEDCGMDSKVYCSVGGYKYDVGRLINIIAVACDEKNTRDILYLAVNILYLAVKLDIGYALKFGMKQKQQKGSDEIPNR